MAVPGRVIPNDAEIDLSRDDLPAPRLHPIGGVVYVPAFTDLKVHDICDGPSGVSGVAVRRTGRGDLILEDAASVAAWKPQPDR